VRGEARIERKPDGKSDLGDSGGDGIIILRLIFRGCDNV